MIDLEVIDYLNLDSTLDTLLSASASDSKIYPEQAQGNTSIDSLPYIVYNVSSDGTTEENLKEISITFNITAETYLSARLIKNQLLSLLDVNDNIRNLISSTEYKYYWAKHTGGTTFKDPDLDCFHWVVIFDFKYGVL